MITFVWNLEIYAGHGPWRISILIRIPMSASGVGEWPYPFSVFSSVLNGFHRQLWDSRVTRERDSRESQILCLLDYVPHGRRAGAPKWTQQRAVQTQGAGTDVSPPLLRK